MDYHMIVNLVYTVYDMIISSVSNAQDVPIWKTKDLHVLLLLQSAGS